MSRFATLLADRLALAQVDLATLAALSTRYLMRVMIYFLFEFALYFVASPLNSVFQAVSARQMVIDQMTLAAKNSQDAFKCLYVQSEREKVTEGHMTEYKAKADTLSARVKQLEGNLAKVEKAKADAAREAQEAKAEATAKEAELEREQEKLATWEKANDEVISKAISEALHNAKEAHRKALREERGHLMDEHACHVAEAKAAAVAEYRQSDELEDLLTRARREVAYGGMASLIGELKSALPVSSLDQLRGLPNFQLGFQFFDYEGSLDAFILKLEEEEETPEIEAALEEVEVGPPWRQR